MRRTGHAAGEAVAGWSTRALAALERQAPEIVALAAAELQRRGGRLNLVAASSPTLPAALVAQSLLFSSVTAEGYVGGRYHPGTEAVDEVERLAIARATAAFGADHANVQPLSGSAANLAVLYGVLDAGDTVVSLELAHGGHLSHVSRAASVSRRVPARYYRVEADGTVDADALAALVAEARPRLVICGGSALPRAVDYAAFRAAADAAGALLLADVSHVSGLVAAGVHPSPVGVADVVTTSTYKQLCGPRGGLILRGAGSRLEAAALDRAVFPGFQGTPDYGAMAAKAVALAFAATPVFTAAMRRVAAYARLAAAALAERGVPLVGGGTDTHMVLVDLRAAPVSGRVVAETLERAGVLVNKNVVPGDTRSPRETSGIRLGTNDLAFRVMDEDVVEALAARLAAVVAALAEGAPPERCPGLDALAEAAGEVAARPYIEELQPR